ncbi:TlpA disulfide reductase family protein, partial [Labrenzia sp. OB1]
MLKRLLLSITLTLFISPVLLVQASNVSQQLLTMPITLTTGEVVTLAQYQGKKPVYLKFWATWCKPCIEQMPHFEQISQQHSDNLAIIAINLGINDNLAAVQKMQQEFNLSMPMAIDKSGDLAQAFRLLGTPYHLLFD